MDEIFAGIKKLKSPGNFDKIDLFRLDRIDDFIVSEQIIYADLGQEAFGLFPQTMSPGP